MKVPQEHSAFGQAWTSSSCCMHFFAASSINLDRLSVISFDRAYCERTPLLVCSNARELANLWLCELLGTMRAADEVGAFVIESCFDVLVVAFEADIGGVLLISSMRFLRELIRSDVVGAVIC